MVLHNGIVSERGQGIEDVGFQRLHCVKQLHIHACTYTVHLYMHIYVQ